MTQKTPTNPALDHSIQILNIGSARVLYIQNSSFLTNIQILTGVGSMAETRDEMGMAHILEHMFFKGSKKRPGGTTISRAANDLGARMNAYTTYDHTVYYISVLNDDFEEGFDILADMYQNPIFPPEEFQKELNPILSEYREREDDPDNFLFERALLAYLGDGYHPTIGTPESIRSATVEKMHSFKSRFYGGDNILISIVGGVSLERIRPVIENLFAEKSMVQTPPPVRLIGKNTELVLEKPGIQEAYYTLLYPAHPPASKERYTQDVMNYILGGNDSALLFERIREELGMSCYGIYSWTLRHEPFSVLGISTSIDPGELDQLHNETMDQIKRLMDRPPEEHQLKRAKASIRSSIAARSETSAGLSGMISLPVLRGETRNPVSAALEAIESITVNDILESARSTFDAPYIKAVLLPDGNEDLDDEE